MERLFKWTSRGFTYGADWNSTVVKSFLRSSHNLVRDMNMVDQWKVVLAMVNPSKE